MLFRSSAFVPEFDIHDVLANDDHAIVLVTQTATRNDTGDTFEGRYVHIFHVGAEKVLESWMFWEDQAAGDAFLAGLK